MSDLFWNDERIEKLKTLFAEGLSLGDIAIAMNVTRNTIAGKSNRLKLKRPKRKRKQPPRSTTRADRDDILAIVKVAMKPLRPMCRECGWRKGGIDSWDGNACKCGVSGAPIVIVQPEPPQPDPQPPQEMPQQAAQEPQEAPCEPPRPFQAPEEQAPPERADGALRLLELGFGRCKFPIGGMMDRAEFFCGKPTCDRGPGSYCASCANRAYQNVSRRSSETQGVNTNGKTQPKNFASI